MEPILRLVVIGPQGAERSITLPQADITIGRGATNDVVLTDPKTSRVHTRLTWHPSGWVLADLDSANGTWVNGERIRGEVPVTVGDAIRAGDTLLRLEAGPAAAPAAIETPADLEATLADATIPVQLNDTRTPRLAVHAPDPAGGPSTWELPILGDALTIGRQATCDVVLNRANVSRQHARIERRGDSFWLRDLGSTNGTFLRGRRIDEHRLQDGDSVRIGDATLVFKQATSPDDLTVLDIAAAPAGGRPRVPVVIVPGLMGSELWLGRERVWPNVKLLFTQPELFMLPDRHPLEPRAIVGEVVIIPQFVEQEQYNRAGDFLTEALGYRRGVDLLEFAYDWRQDVRESARRLSEAIDKWGVAPPITIIAHSLGTLVSRYYIERLDGKDKVGRALLVGGPHRGAPRMATDLVEGVGLLPLGLLGNRLLQVIKTFPSVYQFLPTYPCAVDQDGQPIDLLTDERWLPADQLPLLRAGRKFQAELGLSTSVPAVCIYGYGLKTVTNLSVKRDAAGRWSKVDCQEKPGGDNRVPEQSAILPGTEIHPVCQGHGSLYVDNDVKARLKVELTR